MISNSLCIERYPHHDLFMCVKDVYETIIDMFIDRLNAYDGEGRHEVLTDIFPRSFVRRNPQRAEQIIYDLKDIIHSDLIHEDLPPLYIYAMLGLLEDFDAGLRENKEEKDLFFAENKELLRQKYSDSVAEEFYDWLDFIVDDFYDIYDDNDYTLLQLWESAFLDMLKNPEKFYTSPEIEDMLELMSNDIVIQWNRLKDSQRYIVGLQSNIIEFKRFIESNGYEVFQTNPLKEELCRTLLQSYLIPRGFREAHMGGGRSDLTYPDYDTIIETKIWRGQQSFEDGIVEILEYLKSQKYHLGYYIVFYSNHLDFIDEQKSDIFDTEKDGYTIRCIFINTQPTAPSKKNRNKR